MNKPDAIARAQHIERAALKALAAKRALDDEVEARGWTFIWEQDEDPDLSWMTDEERAEEHEVLGCVLKDRRGEVLESLWGIVDADRAYGQEIEAQLVEEAMFNIRAALLEAI